MNVGDKVFGCKILVHVGKRYGMGSKCLKHFDNYTFKQYTKWRWYFRYLTARYQVQYKDRFVELREFSYPKYDKREMEKRGIKNKIIATKRTITKYKNIIEKARKQYNQLFPFEEQELYKKAMAKIERTEQKQRDLQTKYDNYIIR